METATVEATADERKKYIMAVVTLACADKKVTPEELDLVKKTATRLKMRVRRKDFKAYDLQSIALGITRPELRKELFLELVTLAGADKLWDREELRIIKYFATMWSIALPELPHVDWEDIRPLDYEDVQSINRWKQMQMPMRKDVVKSADPGFQWKWMFAAAGIYFGISISFGMAMASYGFAGNDIASGILSLVACFAAGMIVGKNSPGYTLREPAVGVTIPLAVFAVIMVPAVMKKDALENWILVTGVAALLLYGVSMLGAWIGEKWQAASE